MAAGVTSLGLVRDELFATMGEAEQYLERFIVDRNNGSLLQQAVEAIHQIRGTLTLIELTGAELLAQEMLRLVTDIPVGAGAERDGQLASLSNALYVLGRYLEGVDINRQEIPELLIPAINALRQVNAQPVLPESFFFSVRLDQQRHSSGVERADRQVQGNEGRRLRLMFQVGLLGYIREQNFQANLKLMARALARLDALFGNTPAGQLCWVVGAVIEAMQDGQLLSRKSRKQTLSRVDRELKRALTEPQYEAPKGLLKELLYLVALADSRGPLVSQVKEVFALHPLPFTDHLLEEESQRLAGPGQAVMRSLSAAIQEELTTLKDALDLIERGVTSIEAFQSLYAQLGKLAKTLGMVGLASAATALQSQLQRVSEWRIEVLPTSVDLQRLADVVLYVESAVASLERGPRRESRTQSAQQADSFAQHQLAEARIVVIEEAQAGLALAKRAITAYIESNGEKLHLVNVPFSLQAVRGGLWFLGQERAARLIEACASYIQQHMLDAAQMPAEQMLETLADALASLEYYLEGGAALQAGQSRDGVLELAADSVKALGVTVVT